LVSARICWSDNERFLEQFGYIIVASHLLDGQSAPSYSAVAGLLTNSTDDGDQSVSRAAVFGLRGVIVTAAASFSIAWLLNWARPRPESGFDPQRLLALFILTTTVVIAFYTFAKRQWLKYLRLQAVDVASVLVGNAQALDSVASASVVLIQEVELVSRGYRMFAYAFLPRQDPSNFAIEVHRYRQSAAWRNRPN
jgi:hypothetical protein